HALCSLVYFGIRAHQRGLNVWPVLLLAFALSALVLAGALDGLLPQTLWAPRAGGRSVLNEAVETAWVGVGATGLRRGLFLYVFGQQLHFATWLRFMPEVDRVSKVPYSFRRALEALRRDLGVLALPALGLGALSALLLLAGGGPAREAYFALTY